MVRIFAISVISAVVVIGKINQQIRSAIPLKPSQN
jgi:hypothetical protein